MRRGPEQKRSLRQLVITTCGGELRAVLRLLPSLPPRHRTAVRGSPGFDPSFRDRPAVASAVHAARRLRRRPVARWTCSGRRNAGAIDSGTFAYFTEVIYGDGGR